MIIMIVTSILITTTMLNFLFGTGLDIILVFILLPLLSHGLVMELDLVDVELWPEGGLKLLRDCHDVPLAVLAVQAALVAGVLGVVVIVVVGHVGFGDGGSE